MMRIGIQPRTCLVRACVELVSGAARSAVLAFALIVAGSAASMAQSPNPNPANPGNSVATNPFQLNLINPIDPRTGQLQSNFPQQPGGVLGTRKKPDKTQPLLLEGDELIYDTRNNRVIARGNVQIYFDDHVLTGDKITYDQSANTLTAEGNVQIREPNGNTLRGDKLVTTDDFRDAFIQSLSAVGKDDSRIAARRAVRKDGNVTEFEQAKFTPCKNDPGQPPLWCVSGQRIVHDQQAGSIVYQDAVFEVLGVPILWAPFFSHGDASVSRRTGFLAPTYGTNSSLGTIITVPYYIATAPNADFLFQPQYLSKQGVLWRGDWRHRLAAGSEYSIKVAGIEQNGANLPSTLDPLSRSQLDGWRGSVQTQGALSLSSWWRFGWDLTLESDDTFRRFYKLDGILQTDKINTAYLEGISERNYFSAKFYHFGGLLLQDTLPNQTGLPSARSQVYPVIDYSYIFDKPVVGGELSVAGNASSMTRKDGTDSTRVAAEANWRSKTVDPLGQVWTPFLGARADVTRYTNAFDPENGIGVADGTTTRALGMAGVTYSYPFVANTADASHVVEPIGQVIIRPSRVSQQIVPNEDARSLVWDDTLLFDKDKFSGWDRIETGGRANVGLQYTFQSNKGGYARFIAGQSFQLTGDNAFTNPGLVPSNLNNALAVPGSTPGTTVVSNALVPNFQPNSGLNTNQSDYVLGAYFAPTQNFRVVAQGRFDESDYSLKRGNLYSSAIFGPLRLTTQYSYSRDDLVQPASQQEIIGAGTLKLTDRWAVGSMLRYDIDANVWLQQQYQVKYSDECFVLTATYTDNNIHNPALSTQHDRTLMLRFELKYLGDFKYQTSISDTAFGNNQPAK